MLYQSSLDGKHVGFGHISLLKEEVNLLAEVLN
jgi:hypothetical protein